MHRLYIVTHPDADGATDAARHRARIEAECKRLTIDLLVVPARRPATSATTDSSDARYRYDADGWTVLDGGVFRGGSVSTVVTVGGGADGWRALPRFASLPPFARARWEHAATWADVDVGKLRERFAARIATDRAGTPRVSVWTTTYRSGDKLMRPYASLRKQTYPDWEWVVMDDSPPDVDKGDTWERLLAMQTAEPDRIRLYRQPRNDGCIGAVKRDVCRLCRGEFLVELDHDDELREDALERIVHAFESAPNVAFVSTDWAEPFEDEPGAAAPADGRCAAQRRFFHFAGGYWGYGFGSQHCEYDELSGERLVVVHRPPINAATVRSLLAAPNHARCWSAAAYDAVGGHDARLWVSDDCDLMMRTFAYAARTGARLAHVPLPLYYQYRNAGANNFTNHRNVAIQALVAVLAQKHEPAITAALAAARLRDYSALGCCNNLCWWQYASPTDPHHDAYDAGVADRAITADDRPRLSVIVYADGGVRADQLLRTLMWLRDDQRTASCGVQIVVVAGCGFRALDLEAAAHACAFVPSGLDRHGNVTWSILDGSRLRWWLVEPNRCASAAEMVNYASLTMCVADRVAVLRAGDEPGDGGNTLCERLALDDDDAAAAVLLPVHRRDGGVMPLFRTALSAAPPAPSPPILYTGSRTECMSCASDDGNDE